jgi:hypothetical protein
LAKGHFIEATFENWESEFLQMGMYVVLTIFLFPERLVRIESAQPHRAR